MQAPTETPATLDRPSSKYGPARWKGLLSFDKRRSDYSAPTASRNRSFRPSPSDENTNAANCSRSLPIHNSASRSLPSENHPSCSNPQNNFRAVNKRLPAGRRSQNSPSSPLRRLSPNRRRRTHTQTDKIDFAASEKTDLARLPKNCRSRTTPETPATRPPPAHRLKSCRNYHGSTRVARRSKCDAETHGPCSNNSVIIPARRS